MRKHKPFISINYFASIELSSLLHTVPSLYDAKEKGFTTSRDKEKMFTTI